MSNQKLVSIGNYSLSSCTLGKGSFAFVNKSTHSILKKDVALKVMIKNKIKDDYILRHYKREAHLQKCTGNFTRNLQDGVATVQ